MEGDRCLKPPTCTFIADALLFTQGVEHGVTQIATAGSSSTAVASLAASSSGSSASFTDKQSLFVFNYPLDITFSSTSVFGWPQISLSLYSLSSMGKDTIEGYCSQHLPLQPGKHVRYLRLYAPESSSMCQRLIAWITGNRPEFFDSRFAAAGKGREGQ